MTSPQSLTLPSATTDRAEHLSTLVRILGLLRLGHAATRAELAQETGLSRSVVTQRVGQLLDLGLVEEVGLAASTGGRAPRRLRFRADVGRLLVISAGASGVTVAVTDLAGTMMRSTKADLHVSAGPEVFLGGVETLAAALLAEADEGPAWGIGIGLPGPIEFASGRPTAPPIMPGWDGYDVRGRLSAGFQAPAWVDNDVNVMALGELHAGRGRGVDDLVVVKVGTGIGAGLVSAGSIHRGANGAAGDVGHVAVVDSSSVVCRCGNKGCLEALAGGAALVRDAVAAMQDGTEGQLAERCRQGHGLTVQDIGLAARLGDPLAMALLARSGELVGEMLATLVSFFNPALVLLSGSVSESGGVFLTAVRETVYRLSLPLATRDLRIEVSEMGASAGVTGAAAMVLEELFIPSRLEEWITSGLPNRGHGERNS